MSLFLILFVYARMRVREDSRKKYLFFKCLGGIIVTSCHLVHGDFSSMFQDCPKFSSRRTARVAFLWFKNLIQVEQKLVYLV